MEQLPNSERVVITFAAEVGLPTFFPRVGPEQVHSIEIDEYAHELATVTVWIGYIPVAQGQRLSLKRSAPEDGLGGCWG
jgi:hypothetical protein